MSILSASSSAVPSASIQLYQFKLQQARQEAAQAESEVKALESKTEQARRQSSEARSNVGGLEQQSRQAQSSVNAQGQITGRVINTKA